MNLNLDLDIKKLLPMLRRAEPYVFGVALIAVFGYTAWVVNAAINVKPTTDPALAPAAPTAKITFDKSTIEALKNLQVVQGNVSTGDLGTDNPFQ